ncbi:MAG: DUF5763 domain-containing protein, partial [Cyclobacteriaceae bacterium]
TATQCKGIAKSTGARCKIRTTNENGYCHHHQAQVNNNSNRKITPTQHNTSNRCQATTNAGTRCKRKAEAGSRYCWQHK